MVIESRHPGGRAIWLGEKRVDIEGLTRIVREECKEKYFRSSYTPVGQLSHGEQSGFWEHFVSRDSALSVPVRLTKYVREIFPDCRWDLSGFYLFAVQAQRIVAIIGNGVQEPW